MRAIDERILNSETVKNQYCNGGGGGGGGGKAGNVPTVLTRIVDSTFPIIQTVCRRSEQTPETAQTPSHPDLLRRAFTELLP